MDAVRIHEQAKLLADQKSIAGCRSLIREIAATPDFKIANAANAQLAGIVYDTVLEDTKDSWHMMFDLCILLGHIVTGRIVTWHSSNLPELHEVLVRHFPSNHPLWGCIAIFDTGSADSDSTE